MPDRSGINVKSLKSHTSIPDLQKRLEDELYKARTELNQYATEYEKLNSKVQHANKMRDLLLNAVEAMATKPDQKANLLLFKERYGKALREKKPVRVGNIPFYLDQDFQGELEALREVVENYKKRVFLLEKAVESLGQLKPGRERSLRVIDEDGIPLRVLVRN
jgi:hypothetical protein